jgi:ATP-dependent helicase/nuclease subunit A
LPTSTPFPAWNPPSSAVRNLPPLHYTEDDWEIVRACFTLLRHAAAQLKVVFAEAALGGLRRSRPDCRARPQRRRRPSQRRRYALADGIRHLLVDEFQDTSRRQHQLLANLIAAWPDSSPDQGGRTCFLVGDPMQSIYFFRDADAELFARVKEIGLEIPDAEPLLFRLRSAKRQLPHRARLLTAKRCF